MLVLFYKHCIPNVYPLLPLSLWKLPNQSVLLAQYYYNTIPFTLLLPVTLPPVKYVDIIIRHLSAPTCIINYFLAVFAY